MVDTTMAATSPGNAEKIGIEVWSDVVCPFCWIGKAHLEQALDRLRMRDEVEVVFRSFELNPGETRSEPVHEHLARKYGGPARARQMSQNVARMGQAAGLAMDFDRAVVGSTFDAHRLAHLAREKGRGNEVMEALMKAYFSEGMDVADHEALRRVAVEAGLDGSDVDRVLASDAYADAVRADVAQARAYNVGGVPFFVLAGRYAVSGAQPVELFVEALARVRAERAPLTLVGEGAACVDGACEAPVAADERMS